MPRLPLASLGAIVAALVATAPAQAHAGQPTLAARALLPADARARALPRRPQHPPRAAPGSRQPVGGFSALLDAPGDDTYWAMPDNGFGDKANSRSFLLRVYTVKLDPRRSGGRGDGSVRILDEITLRDPDHKLGFAIVAEGTSERLLTGGDLDIESVRRAPDGTLWFGEEFGPFLVHTSAAEACSRRRFRCPA